jgi:uncharacterized protein YkwD
MKKLVGACLLSAACTTGTVNAHAQSIEARQLMQATNEDRAQRGLGPLKWDPALARAAQALSHRSRGRLRHRKRRTGLHHLPAGRIALLNLSVRGHRLSH